MAAAALRCSPNGDACRRSLLMLIVLMMKISDVAIEGRPIMLRTWTIGSSGGGSAAMAAAAASNSPAISCTSKSSSSSSKNSKKAKGDDHDTAATASPPPCSGSSSALSGGGGGHRQQPPTTQLGLPAVVESQASFALYYSTTYKVVQNLFYNYTYLLLPKDSEEVSYQYRGRDWDANVTAFQAPLSNYTLATSSAAGFLELLGCLGKLGGVAPAFSAASPCVLELLGRIPTVATDAVPTTAADVMGSPPVPAAAAQTEGNSSSSSSIINVMNVEAVLSSPDSPTYATDITRLPNFISFDALRERTPLQRAEWIKFIAAFFDMEATANSVYAQIEADYKCVSGNALREAAIYYGSNASTSGDGGSNADDGRRRRPTVAWLSFHQGSWSFSDTPYKLQFTLDAGGVNLDQNVLSMTFNMSNESDTSIFYDISMTLDVVIDETYTDDPSIYTFDNFVSSTNFTNTSELPFLLNKRLWRYDKRVGLYNALDWFEGAIAQPQVVLRDLIYILYPEMTNDGYNSTYFRNIALGERILNTTSLTCLHDITSLAQPTTIPCPTKNSLESFPATRALSILNNVQPPNRCENSAAECC